MDTIKSRRLSLEEKLEQLKQQELNIAAKREAVEKKLTDQAREERTRAFVCMGAMIDKLLAMDVDLKRRLLAESRKENFNNRRGMGHYWRDFMPTEEELAKMKRKKEQQEPTEMDSEE